MVVSSLSADLGWLYGYLHLLLAIGRDASPNYGFIPIFGGGGRVDYTVQQEPW